LRDIGRIFLGLCLGDKIGLYNSDQVIKLWVHESERVFSDRLLIDDSSNFAGLMTDILKKAFSKN